MYMSILSYANLETQIYGPTLEMEIKFELEASDLDCVFTPDFRVQSNTSDETQVSWRLPNGGSQISLAFLFPELSDEGPIYTIGSGRNDV